MWTQFWDMHSGGGKKEQWSHIYIEAVENEARLIFYNRFGHNPERVSCTCCGSDYSISADESLAQLTGYHRHCRAITGPKTAERPYGDSRYIEDGDPIPDGWKLSKYTALGKRNKYLTLDQYAADDEVLVIYAKDISDSERLGTVPQQGYVWQD